MRLSLSLVVVSAVAIVVVEPRSSGASERAPAAAAQSAVELSRRLEQPVSLAWTGMPLRQGLGRIAERWGVGVLLDRRIDPGQSITMVAESMPLRGLLQRVAAQGHAAMAVVGNIVYIGPVRTVERLPTMWAIHRERVRRLAPRWRSRWLRKVPGGWHDLSEPRQLCRQIVEQVGGSVVDVQEQVPHDLWADASLPPMPRCDRLTLVLAQFDLGYEVHPMGSKKTAAGPADDALIVQIVAWPERPLLEKRYAGGHDPDGRAAFWRRLAPDARIGVEGGKILVRGSWADHQRLLSSLSLKKRPSGYGPDSERRGTSKGVRRYDLRVNDVPARKLIEAVARKLGRKISFDQRLSPSDLQRQVSVDVHQKPADELLRAVIEAAGLKLGHGEGGLIVVRPAMP